MRRRFSFFPTLNCAAVFGFALLSLSLSPVFGAERTLPRLEWGATVAGSDPMAALHAANRHAFVTDCTTMACDASRDLELVFEHLIVRDAFYRPGGIGPLRQRRTEHDALVDRLLRAHPARDAHRCAVLVALARPMTGGSQWWGDETAWRLFEVAGLLQRDGVPCLPAVLAVLPVTEANTRLVDEGRKRCFLDRQGWCALLRRD
jgi:hypothetical protein